MHRVADDDRAGAIWGAAAYVVAERQSELAFGRWQEPPERRRARAIHSILGDDALSVVHFHQDPANIARSPARRVPRHLYFVEYAVGAHARRPDPYVPRGSRHPLDVGVARRPAPFGVLPVVARSGDLVVDLHACSRVPGRSGCRRLLGCLTDRRRSRRRQCLVVVAAAGDGERHRRDCSRDHRYLGLHRVVPFRSCRVYGSSQLLFTSVAVCCGLRTWSRSLLPLNVPVLDPARLDPEGRTVRQLMHGPRRPRPSAS